MALSIYVAAVKEFEAALSEAERYLTFVTTSNQMRPWIGKLVAWDKLQAHEKSALKEFIGQKDYHVELGHNGLIVAISAAFEHLVRRIVREGVEWINAKYDDYGSLYQLSQPLLHQNLIRSGHALATVAEPPAEIKYDYEGICKNLGTCRTDGGKLVLNADAFSIRIINVNRKRIKRYLKRIGVEIDWDFFGRQQQFQAHFNTKAGRKTTDEVEKYLTTFLHLRNRIVHSGIGVRVTKEDIGIAVSFFRLFARFLAEATELALKKSHT